MTNATIFDMISFFMVIIPLCAGVRIAQCLVMMSCPTEDRKTDYKLRIKNVIIFTLCAECILTIISLVTSYYGGNV